MNTEQMCELQTNLKLKPDKKGRYYLPDELFYKVVDKKSILVIQNYNTIHRYAVHNNKDGSYWIKGYNILKYFDCFYDGINNIPKRVFLSENIINQINQCINT